MENNAKLFVISAPSGCGKGTILSRAFQDKDVYYSISCTTRKPREGEMDGVEYYFVSNSKFEQMVNDGEFLEYAGYADHYYGTPAKAVRDNLENGRDVVLEIETKGAFQIKDAMPEAVLIFILPPSITEINRRLHKRATETEEIINKRVMEAQEEILKAEKYDYVIMNDGLEQAVEDFMIVFNSLKSNDCKADKFKAKNENIKQIISEVLNNA